MPSVPKKSSKREAKVQGRCTNHDSSNIHIRLRIRTMNSFHFKNSITAVQRDVRMKESEENKTETFGNEIKTHNAKMFVINKTRS